MAEIEIYTWATCPFCRRAKALLDDKDLDYTEYDISGDDAARARMAERTGGPNTLPQIFINDTHIGGCDELIELEENGGLDKMVGG